MVLSGALAQDAARQDGEQKCPCLVCWFTRPVSCGRNCWAGTPLRLFTRAGTAALGGYPAGGCT